MSEISAQIGSQIRTLRKKRKMTLDDLSGIIHKSRSTISKYEKGEIAIDIETLYEIADAIQVHVEQLLYCPPRRAVISSQNNSPAFLTGSPSFTPTFMTAEATTSSGVYLMYSLKQKMTSIKS